MKLNFLLLLTLFSLNCHATDYNRVYITSFPRSGNHWLRYLIEDTTGIATASVYRDRTPAHIFEPFPWGFSAEHGYKGNCRYPTKRDLVFLKTHFPSVAHISKFDGLDYKKTIRIVRHPIDCFYSYFVFKLQKPYPDKISREKLVEYIEKWKYFQEYWNDQPDVVTFRYEDLLVDPIFQLYQILEEAGQDFGIEELEYAVEMNPPHDYSLKHLIHYTEEDLELIKTELKDLLEQFDYEITINEDIKKL